MNSGGTGSAGAGPSCTGGGRTVLLAAAGLHMVTQSALAPFYPQLFREVFGVRDFAATGTFLVVCQLAAVVALPLWGRASRRLPLARLVTAGQSAAVLLAASLAFAPTYAVFTALSVVLIAAKSVVLLAHPALARNHPRGLLPGIVQYVAVLHAAAVVATVLGTVVVSVPDPRVALPLLAVVETLLLGACVVMLRAGARAARAPRSERAETTGAPHAVTGAEVRAAGMLRLAAFVLLNAVAINAVRPYFTEYAASGGAGTTGAAVLFLLPHFAVLAVLFAAGALRQRLGSLLLPGALGLAAGGLLWQALVTDTVPLALARLLFGVGLGLGQVALDERVLTATGTGPAYSVIVAAQTGGLLLAPLLATLTVSASAAGPLLAGAGLLTVLLLFALFVPPSAVPGLPRRDARTGPAPGPAARDGTGNARPAATAGGPVR